MQISVDVILYICGAIVSIATAVGIVSKYFTKIIKKNIKESIDESMKTYQAESDKKIMELKNVLETHIENSDGSNDLIKDVLLSLTRDRINRAHSYYMNREKIGTYTLSTLEDLYVSYLKLGGNSFVHKEMEDLRELEVVSAEEMFTNGGEKDYD